MNGKRKADKSNRRYPLMPKPAVFRRKTDYDRKRYKSELRERLMKEE